jgi:hypothetical protein
MDGSTCAGALHHVALIGACGRGRGRKAGAEGVFAEFLRSKTRMANTALQNQCHTLRSVKRLSSITPFWRTLRKTGPCLIFARVSQASRMVTGQVAGFRPLGIASCRAALKTVLPHFRCRVKLRLKHPRAALALLEARNLPAHTSAA